MIAARLADRSAALVAERVPFVQATVVRASRPASVQVGATALVLRDGTIEGFVGGHCAEPSVRLHALHVLETGEALLLRIEPGAGDEAATEGAVTVHNPCISGGALEIFLEPRIPAARVHVLGDTPIAQALTELARTLGYDVGTGEPTSDDAAVIVASHGRDEEQALAAALDARRPLRRPRRQPQARRRRRGDAPGQRRRQGARAHARRPRHRGPDAGGDRPVDPRGDRRDEAAHVDRPGRGPAGPSAPRRARRRALLP